jgi:ribosomal protein S1
MNVSPEQPPHTEPVRAQDPPAPESTTPPAPEPQETPAPSTPEASEPTPTPAQTPELSGDVAREAEAAMAAAAAAPATEDEHKPKKIRGPRLVQGGREYRKGAVVSVGPDDIFLEFGPKELGVVPRSQLKEDAPVPAIGDQMEVVVSRFDTSESLLICSLPGTVQKADWEMLEKGQIVEARVTGTNKGGLELEVAKHRAFMPASQVDIHRVPDLSVFVGEKLTCKVTRIDRGGRGNITLSRRDVLAVEQKERLGELKTKLTEGDEIEGTIRKIMPFGAFVDMGGVDGLLHISDISHDRVDKVEDKLSEGQQVRVRILKLDWDSGRHSLGLKQLEPDPFEEALKELNEGDVTTGIVTKLLDFGCFVRIGEQGPGIEGLVHISELDWKRVEKTSDVVQPNATVKVKVLKIDKDKKKLSLSIKQTKDRPQQPGGGPGRGRGRKGRGEADTRSPEEILKETPEFRRLREKFKKQQPKAETPEEDRSAGGLGSSGGMGLGLGDLKLGG